MKGIGDNDSFGGLGLNANHMCACIYDMLYSPPAIFGMPQGSLEGHAMHDGCSCVCRSRPVEIV